MATISYNQQSYLLDLRKGTPCDEEVNLNDAIRNLLHYEVLTYRTETTSLVVFEKLLRSMSVVSKIYADRELGILVEAAKAALDQSRSPEADDYSPNQRRALLKPLLEICHRAAEYDQIVPATTTDRIAQYCSAVQIALYTTTLYSRPRGQVSGVFDIISGRDTFRNLAKKSGAKESDFKNDILDTAWLLYRIAECFAEVQPPESITDLKQAVWKPFGDHEELQRKIKMSAEKWLIPFENHTGITPLDYKKFREDCVRIEKEFLN